MRTESRQEFLELLSHTSRSFSIGILGLAQPIQDSVCLGYLLCRIFDTYEDTVSISPELRRDCLTYSLALMESLADPQAIETLLAQWSQRHRLNSEWTVDRHPEPWEHALLKAGEKVWREVAALEPEVRSLFRDALTDMVTGMRTEIEERQIRGDRRPRTPTETDDYCYTVAGTVGRLLTGLFKQQGALKNCEDAIIERQGIAFGKALQLVNIMKDFHKDWSEGRCYWPGLPLPAGSATKPPEAAILEPIFRDLNDRFRRYSDEARTYIASLGEDRKDLTFFCAFPLRMAAATMDQALADMSWLGRGSTFKVSRAEVAAILSKLI